MYYLISMSFSFSFFFSPSSWYLVSEHWDQRRYWIQFQFFKIYWGLICHPRCGLSWWMFHVHLRRKCILLHLDGKSWRYQLDLFGLMFYLRFVFPYWFCFDDLFIDDCGVLKSPTITVLLLISPLMPLSVCLLYWAAPVLGA